MPPNLRPASEDLGLRFAFRTPGLLNSCVRTLPESKRWASLWFNTYFHVFGHGIFETLNSNFCGRTRSTQLSEGSKGGFSQGGFSRSTPRAEAGRYLFEVQACAPPAPREDALLLLVSLSLYIYIYIMYTYVYVYIYIYIYTYTQTLLSITLSLS